LDTCPTIKIKAANGDGYVLVNETDFNPARHERFGALPPPPAPPAEKPTLTLPKGKR